MTEKHLAIVGAIILAIIAGLGFLEWSRENADRAALAATMKAEQQNIDAIEKAAKARDAVLEDQIARLEKIKASVQTPAQAIKILPEYLPPLPEPIHVNTVPSPENPKLQQPDSVTVPAADLAPLARHEIECAECQKELPVCKADLADQKKINAALTAQRDMAVKAAKGGGFWRRLAHDAKVVVISVGVGIIAGRVLGG